MFTLNEPPQRRRSPAQVQAEREAFLRAVKEDFQRAIEHLGKPQYVQSNTLLRAMFDCGRMQISEAAFKLHAQKILLIMGWEKMPNPASKDGRWYAHRESFYLYGKKGKTRVGRAFLKKELGW